MEIDPSSLDRIQAFAEFLQRAKEAGAKLSFVSTPTEHGDNITATATINDERTNIGLLFWDVSLLQERGLVTRRRRPRPRHDHHRWDGRGCGKNSLLC